MSRKKRRTFTAEQRAEAVKIARESDKPLTQVAKDLGLSPSALRNWVKQAEADEGKGPAGALTSEEKAELSRLRRENKQLTQENAFLKKASAFFAKESL